MFELTILTTLYSKAEINDTSLRVLNLNIEVFCFEKLMQDKVFILVSSFLFKKIAYILEITYWLNKPLTIRLTDFGLP